MSAEMDAFVHKIRTTNVPVYFANMYEEAYIKYDPNGHAFYVKFWNGNPEFKAKPESTVVMDAFLEHTEISKSKYDSV